MKETAGRGKPSCFLRLSVSVPPSFRRTADNLDELGVEIGPVAESRHLKDVAEVDAIHDREYGQLPSRLPDLGLKFQSLIMERGDHMFQMRFEVELRFGNHEGEV